jgi:ACS family glucarate transporter-like MFS transporter
MGDLKPSLPGGIASEASTAGRPTRVRYLVLAAGCSMALLAYVQRLGYAGYAPEMKRDFGLNDQDLGYLVSAFLVAYAVFQIPTGLAGDRLGARLLLTVFVLSSSIATAAIGLVPREASSTGQRLDFLLRPFVLLLVLRALFGAMQSGIFPVFTRVVADWLPLTERGSAQGALWTASRLGGALAPPLMAWLLIVIGSWRVALEIVAGLGLLWSAAFWYWFRNRPEEGPRVNDAERALIRAGQPAVDDRPRAIPWKQIVGSRSVWCLCLMYGCCGPAGNFMLTLLPVYLRDHRSLSATTSGWLVGLPLASGFVACVLGGVVSDRLIRRWGSRKWGRRVNGLTGLVLAGLAFATSALVQDVWLLALLLCAAQFGNDINMGPGWAACADVGERYAGTISGAMNMTSNITGAIGATWAGHLLAQGESSRVFFIFGGLWLVGAFCWLGIDVNKPLSSTA